MDQINDKIYNEISPKSRNVNRRPKLAPLNIKFDLKANSPVKENEELSFYADSRSKLKLFNEDKAVSPSIGYDTDDSNDQKCKITMPAMTTGPKINGSGFKNFASISYGSNDSTEMEDEYLELMEMESMDDDENATQMPSDLRSLLCKHPSKSKFT